jgi:hypothetical protein
MLKLNSSYSKKVPVEGQEFSSQSYHASVEVELADHLKPEDLQRRIHETFDLVKASVEAELNGKAVKTEQIPAKAEKQENVEGRATNKQVSYILSLAAKQGMNLAQVNQVVSADFENKKSVYELSRRDASKFLDNLKKAA